MAPGRDGCGARICPHSPAGAFSLSGAKNRCHGLSLYKLSRMGYLGITGTICEKRTREEMTEFEQFQNVIARLRAPDGCPWDREQTHESLKPACIEEAAEVLCGINILTETGNPDNLKEELGDLLLQIVMHAQIAEEEGFFTMEDVIRGVREKMIRRHPHVFGEEHIDTSGAVLNRWEEIKKLEKAGKEWTEAYLPGAFREAEELIDVARRRKERNRNNKGEEVPDVSI